LNSLLIFLYNGANFLQVYFVIVMLPCTKLRECCIIPGRSLQQILSCIRSVDYNEVYQGRLARDFQGYSTTDL